MTLRKFLLLILCLSFALCSLGQTVDNKQIKQDTLSSVAKEIIPKIKPHSPGKATLYSTFLPGLGQIYNKQAWKIPIIYGGIGAAVGFAIYNYQGSHKFIKEYRLRVNGITEGRNPDYVNFPDESIYNLYYAYEKNFELSIFAGAAVYILNIVDAMVYGNLFDYDISPNLSLNLTPYCLPSINSKPSFGLSMRFNLK